VRGNHETAGCATVRRNVWPAPTDSRSIRLGEAWIGKLYDLPATIDVKRRDIRGAWHAADDNTYLLEDTDFGRMAPSPRAAVIERLGAAMNRAVVLCGHSHRQSLTQIPGAR